MRRVITILVLTIFLSPKIAAQAVDVGPSGRKNILPVEGGAIKMKTDSLAPLNQLIDRLNNDWELIETGKGYWIGYTNDMFSIASHGNEAIVPLTNFIKTSESKKTKIGAILTLRLIGINSQIAGRFTENFVGPVARTALLGLLGDKEYTFEIVTLLMRDPWPSDIHTFFRILENESEDEIAWPIINCLRRYHYDAGLGAWYSECVYRLAPPELAEY